MDDSSDPRKGWCFHIRFAEATYKVPIHCPHRGGRLDLGIVNRSKRLVICPLHRSTFQIESGRRIAGPASCDLTVEREPERGES